MKKIYIASPDMTRLTDRLLSEGFTVFNPMNDADLLIIDFELLHKADCVLLSKTHPGRTVMRLVSDHWEIPVYYSLTKLLRREKNDEL